MRCKAKRTLLGLFCTGVLLVVAACSGGSTGSQPQGPAATAPGTGAQGPVAEVKIAMGDFFYDPNEVTIKAGPVRFLLTNVGATAHRFAIRGEGVNGSSKNVGAGRESVFEATLAPGTYKMGCTLGDHEKRGSVGTIRVQ